jgi:hypothetical protein
MAGGVALVAGCSILDRPDALVATWSEGLMYDTLDRGRYTITTVGHPVPGPVLTATSNGGGTLACGGTIGLAEPCAGDMLQAWKPVCEPTPWECCSGEASKYRVESGTPGGLVVNPDYSLTATAAGAYTVRCRAGGVSTSYEVVVDPITDRLAFNREDQSAVVGERITASSLSWRTERGALVPLTAEQRARVTFTATGGGWTPWTPDLGAPADSASAKGGRVARGAQGARGARRIVGKGRPVEDPEQAAQRITMPIPVPAGAAAPGEPAPGPVASADGATVSATAAGGAPDAAAAMAPDVADAAEAADEGATDDGSGLAVPPPPPSPLVAPTTDDSDEPAYVVESCGPITLTATLGDKTAQILLTAGPRDGTCPVATPTGGPVVTGILTLEEIETVVAEGMNDVLRCYSDGRVADPNLAGSILIEFTIGEDGLPKSALGRSSTLKSLDTEICIRSAFLHMVFPLPTSPEVTVVKYPLKFTPDMALPPRPKRRVGPPRPKAPAATPAAAPAAPAAP